MSVFSAVPASSRPTGRRHGSGLPAPAAADQCSVLNDPGLPPRAGSEYDDLRAYGGLLCTQTEDMAQGVPGAARDVHRTAFAWANSTLEARPGKLLSPNGKPLSHYERLATLKALVNKVFAAQYNMQQFLEEQELRLAEDHIASDAASRIQADKEARELEAKEERLRALDEELELREAEDHIAFDAASRIQADKNEARELEAQERLCAQDKDNAQYLEQENDELRIQAEIKREMDTVDAAESEMGVLCEREMDVAAAEPEMGVREMDKTASVKIFPVALQDPCNSKSTAADAPTGSTLNELESRALTAGPRPHAFGAKNQERQPHRLLPRQGQGWPPHTHPD